MRRCDVGPVQDTRAAGKYPPAEPGDTYFHPEAPARFQIVTVHALRVGRVERDVDGVGVVHGEILTRKPGGQAQGDRVERGASGIPIGYAGASVRRATLAFAHCQVQIYSSPWSSSGGEHGLRSYFVGPGWPHVPVSVGSCREQDGERAGIRRTPQRCRASQAGTHRAPYWGHRHTFGSQLIRRVC